MEFGKRWSAGFEEEEEDAVVAGGLWMDGESSPVPTSKGGIGCSDALWLRSCG